MSFKSSTPNSTSTYAYSHHEPFDSFQSKVTELAQSLGECSQVEIRRVRGGSYNRTVAAILTKEGISTAGIFRIPRFSDAITEDGTIDISAVDDNILDHAAVLQFLSEHKVLAPCVLAYDTTAANEIRSPYTFQKFSFGTNLNSVYEQMKVSEKRSIADSLVNFLVDVEAITFSHAGRLCVAANTTNLLKQSLLSSTDRTPLTIETRGFRVRDRETEPTPSLYDLLSNQIKAWTEAETYGDGTDLISQMWIGLSRILQEMSDYGFFSSQKQWDQVSALYHWDLAPRNILVRPEQRSEAEEEVTAWKFDTVIDWDDVYCVPPILCRCPPRWLWDFSDDAWHSSLAGDYDGDVDLLPLDLYTNGTHKLSPEDKELKTYFEQQYVKKLAAIYPSMRQEDYEDQAYGRGRWVRRLARFAMNGASDSKDLERYQRLVKEWDVAKSCYAVRS